MDTGSLIESSLRVHFVTKVVKEDVIKLLLDCLYFAVSLDEVSSLLVQYMCVHVYVLDKKFKRHSLYLKLCMLDGAPNADFLVATLIAVLASAGGVSAEQLLRKLVNISCDGASVLQGIHNGLLAQVGFSMWFAQQSRR